MKWAGTCSGASVTRVTPLARRGEQREVFRCRTTQRPGIMNAGLFRRQERTLEMNPEHAVLNAKERFRGGERRRHLFRGVADQRRQQRGRSEFAVRGGDRAHGFGGRRVVQQHVAAAIDLDVDEARREPGVVRQVANRNGAGDVVARDDGANPVAIDQHCRVVMHSDAVKNPARGDGSDASAHRVRVTFCKCRGRSMSAPRCAARWTRNA